MAVTAKEIVVEDPAAEVWRRLRAFLDVPYTTAHIRQIHDATDPRQKSNIAKQAKQVSYSLQQAEDYFEAASRVTLATRPVLLYYGAVNLTRAIILTRRDGTFSIDALRAAKGHKHHGLEFHFSGVTGPSRDVRAPEFLRKLAVSVHLERGSPWGHFPLVYESLLPPQVFLAVRVQDEGQGASMEMVGAFPAYEVKPLSDIGGHVNLLELCRNLPELHFFLRDIGDEPYLCQGQMYVRATRHWEATGESRELRETVTINDFFMNNLDDEAKGRMIAAYKALEPSLTLEADLGGTIQVRVIQRAVPDAGAPSNYFPDMCDDILGRKFFFLNPSKQIHEVGVHLSILFGLGMFARYFPDEWMPLIEENRQVPETVNMVLDIIARKLPNLALDQITGIRHFVHS